MCTTPAPPSTAFVAASICAGTGEVKTSPGAAASSMPIPTKPPCSGSWPDPPPEMSGTLQRLGAFLREVMCAAADYRHRLEGTVVCVVGGVRMDICGHSRH